MCQTQPGLGFCVGATAVSCYFRRFALFFDVLRTNMKACKPLRWRDSSSNPMWRTGLC